MYIASNLAQGLLNLRPHFSNCFCHYPHSLPVGDAVPIHVPRLHASLQKHLVDLVLNTYNNHQLNP